MPCRDEEVCGKKFEGPSELSDEAWGQVPVVAIKLKWHILIPRNYSSRMSHECSCASGAQPGPCLVFLGPRKTASDSQANLSRTFAWTSASWRRWQAPMLHGSLPIIPGLEFMTYCSLLQFSCSWLFFSARVSLIFTGILAESPKPGAAAASEWQQAEDPVVCCLLRRGEVLERWQSQALGEARAAPLLHFLRQMLHHLTHGCASGAGNRRCWWWCW